MKNDRTPKSMNKADLIKALSKALGLPVRKSEDIVDTMFSTMAKALANGDRIEIRGFGSITVKEYDGYRGRNPKTGEYIDVKPKKVPCFKTAKGLQDRLND